MSQRPSGRSVINSNLELIECQHLLRKTWAQETIAYDTLSGDLHYLGRECGTVLDALAASSPLTFDDLLSALSGQSAEQSAADAEAVLQATLKQLKQLQLVRQSE